MKIGFGKKYLLVALIGSMSVVGPAVADHHGEAISAAVKSGERPQSDTDRDAARKPTEVLMFAGVAPGMTVLDVNAGSGYYTEILSHVVGPSGKVYSHNGAVYWDFMRKTLPSRYDNRRLANVEHIHNDNEVIELPGDSVDVAVAVLSYHDYYFTHKARKGDKHEDVAPVLASIYKALKPGGSFVIVDHAAQAGSTPEDFDRLHRIDPAFVKNQMLTAGFKYAGESDALNNPNDALTGSPFGADIRGKTHRFIYKFVK